MRALVVLACVVACGAPSTPPEPPRPPTALSMLEASPALDGKLVGVTFDGDRVLRILLEPLRLLLQRRGCFGRQIRAVGGEVDDIADVDREVTMRARRHRAVAARERGIRLVLVIGASGDQTTHKQDRK